MLQGALYQARNMAVYAAEIGWHKLEAERLRAHNLEHDVAVARWEPDTEEEEDSLRSREPGASPRRIISTYPVRSVRVATPKPPIFRAESSDWMLHMKSEDICTLHARLPYPDANFMCSAETCDRLMASLRE